jgi:hypothetical protein
MSRIGKADRSIKDKGCGKQKGGTFGDPVTTDVWIRQ